MGFQAESAGVRCSMTENEINYINTCIEYLKVQETDPINSTLQTILRRSEVCIVKTQSFHKGRVWNQRDTDIELRVPIPLLKDAADLQKSLDKLFEATYPERICLWQSDN